MMREKLGGLRAVQILRETLVLYAGLRYVAWFNGGAIPG